MSIVPHFGSRLAFDHGKEGGGWLSFMLCIIAFITAIAIYCSLLAFIQFGGASYLTYTDYHYMYMLIVKICIIINDKYVLLSSVVKLLILGATALMHPLISSTRPSRS